jgi:ribosomal protein S18 acetylase RimI-like enzyme
MAAQTERFTIRPVQISDAASLRQTCWADRAPETISLLIERTRKLAQHGRGLGVVAVRDDGTACAFGLLTVWPRLAEISDLIVSTPYRGQGIGTQIITRLTEAAIGLGVNTLEIGVALSNPRALALYRSLGFTDSRTIDLDLGNGAEPVLYLQKKLAAPRD